tara:strand:+ start:225 stop:509 length:285 start_codon:yes stop_codon:yes gene_type:complete
MEIQNVTSIPSYLEEFISTNKTQLLELFNDEDNKMKSNIFMKCDEGNNKVDVSFFTIEELYSYFEKNEILLNKIIQGNYNCIIHDFNGIFLLKF